MYRLLIADDEVIERTILEKKLNRYFKDSCEIRTAANGRELMEMYESYKPHIMILDIEMPVISGLDAAKEIRRKDKLCSFIFLTAFDEFSYAKEAISVRALDYLLKPCDDKELMLVVEEACRLQDIMRAGQGAVPLAKKELPQPHPETDRFARTNQVKLLSFIQEHYQEDISVQDISDYMGYSEVHSCRLFKQYFGQNFVSYLAEFRMKKAAGYLLHTHMSIKEIGKAVGYNNSNYFAKVFHRLYGMTPSEYREKNDSVISAGYEEYPGEQKTIRKC